MICGPSIFCAYFFQQRMQLPGSGQARVVILLGVAAMPAHGYEAPAAVSVGRSLSQLVRNFSVGGQLTHLT